MEGEVFVSEEDLVMEPMTGDWIRVTSQEGTSRRQVPEGTVILPFEGAKAEVVPGIWDPKQAEGQVYVAAQDTEIVISKGDPLCVGAGQMVFARDVEVAWSEESRNAVLDADRSRQTASRKWCCS